MTPEQFTKARKRLGLTRAQMAATLRVNVRTVQFWEAGARRVPGPVTLALELLAANARDTRRGLAAAGGS